MAELPPVPDSFKALGGGLTPVTWRTNNLLQIRSAMTAARRKNPVTSPVMVTPPTVTLSSTADPTLTQIYTFASAGAMIAPSLASGNDKVNWLGGVPKAFNSSQVAQASSTYYPNLDGNLLNPAGQALTDPTLTADELMVLGGFEFETYAPTVELRLYTDNVSKICFQVDGEYVNKAGYTATATSSVGSGFYNLAFGSAASRRIRVMLIGDPNPSASTHGWMAARTIAVTPAYTIWKPNRTPLRLGLFGDSFTTGVSNFTLPSTSLGYTIGDLLGFSDVRVHGVGSTGYQAAGQGRLPMKDLIPRLLSSVTGAFNLDMAIVLHGYNDDFQTNTVSGPVAVRDGLARLRATNPVLPIVVFGTQAGNKMPASTRLPINEAVISSVVSSFSDPLMKFIPCTPDSVSSWVNGTGWVGTPAGDGNADTACADSIGHPSPAGVSLLAARIAQGASNAIGQMLTAVSADTSPDGFA